MYRVSTEKNRLNDSSFLNSYIKAQILQIFTILIGLWAWKSHKIYANHNWVSMIQCYKKNFRIHYLTKRIGRGQK